MKNFSRALRLGLRYRWTLVASVIAGLMVALFWGANIGIIYPVVQVVLKGDSFHEWVDERITKTEQEIDQLDAKIAALDGGGDDGVLRDAGPVNSQKLASERETKTRALATYRKMRPYIEAYAPHGPFPTLLFVIGFFLIGTLLKVLFLIASTLLVERVTQLATLDLRTEFYRRTLRLDLATFSARKQTDLIARFTADMSHVSLGIQVLVGRAVREPLKIIVCLIGASFICWRLLIFSLVIVPLGLWTVNVLARSLRRASRRILEEMAQLYNVLSESFGGFKVVKAFTMENYERSRFYQCAKEVYRKAMKMGLYNSLVRPATEVMGVVVICVAFLSGAYLVLNQKTHLLGIPMSAEALTLSALITFYGLLIGTTDPLRKLADIYGQMQKAFAASDRVYEMLDREPAVVDPAKPKPLPRHCRDLTFSNVHFHYTSDQPVLQGVDLAIAAGETIAVVGPNGCGKSTLAGLIPRFYDPQQGSVHLDGVDLRDVRQRDVRRQIGLVTQETTLFNDTVFENIRYGSPHAGREKIVAAARQAHAHRFITEKLTDGYETVVGAAGSRLSGGQRQRISLARAILRDPAILILDEATSQVDMESEQLIQQTLSEFVRGRTTVIITHRLGVLSLADRIVVMDQGKILDIGPHEALIGRCELYQRLHLRHSA